MDFKKVLIVKVSALGDVVHALSARGDQNRVGLRSGVTPADLDGLDF